jgi:hypothetical protein
MIVYLNRQKMVQSQTLTENYSDDYKDILTIVELHLFQSQLDLVKLVTR